MLTPPKRTKLSYISREAGFLRGNPSESDATTTMKVSPGGTYEALALEIELMLVLRS